MRGLLGPRGQWGQCPLETQEEGERRCSWGSRGRVHMGSLCSVPFPLKAGLCLSGLLLKEGCRRPPRLNAHWLPGLPCALVSTGGSSCMEAARDADCMVKPAWAGRTLGERGVHWGGQGVHSGRRPSTGQCPPMVAGASSHYMRGSGPG